MDEFDVFSAGNRGGTQAMMGLLRGLAPDRRPTQIPVPGAWPGSLPGAGNNPAASPPSTGAQSSPPRSLAEMLGPLTSQTQQAAGLLPQDSFTRTLQQMRASMEPSAEDLLREIVATLVASEGMSFQPVPVEMPLPTHNDTTWRSRGVPQVAPASSPPRNFGDRGGGGPARPRTTGAHPSPIQVQQGGRQQAPLPRRQTAAPPPAKRPAVREAPASEPTLLFSGDAQLRFWEALGRDGHLPPHLQALWNRNEREQSGGRQEAPLPRRQTAAPPPEKEREKRASKYQYMK